MGIDRLVASLVAPYTEKYIENLDTKQLQLSVFSGAIELTNLSLKRSALNDFNLPVDVCRGSIGKLRITIPWRSLSSKAVEVVLEDLYLGVTPRSAHNATSPTEHKDIILSRNRSVLETHEDALAAAKEADLDNASFTEKLKETMVNNIQVRFERLHVRFEDTLINPSDPFSLGMAIAKLELRTTLSNWEATFVDAVGQVLYKVATLKGFHVYLDRGVTGMPSTWQEDMRTTATGEGQHDHVVQPLDVKVHLSMLSMAGKANKDVLLPEVQAGVYCGHLTTSLTKWQYVKLLEITEFLANYSKREKYSLHRPGLSVSASPASWWRFAIKCTIRTIRSTLFTVDDGHRVREGKKKVREEYIQARKAACSEPWVPPVTERQRRYFERVMEHYEYQLPLSELIACTTLAHLQLARMEELWRGKEEKRRKQDGILSFLRFRKNRTNDESVAQIDEDVRKEFAASIGWDEDDAAAAVPVSKGIGYVKKDLRLSFDGFTVQLKETDNNKPLARTTLTAIEAQTRMREVGMAVSFRVADWAVEDSGQHCVLQQREIASGDGRPLFLVEADKAPIDDRADLALTVRGGGLDVLVNPLWLGRLGSFAAIPPEFNLSTLEASTKAALSHFSDGAARDLTLALEKHSTVEVQGNLVAPRFFFPSDDPSESEGPVSTVLVDLGTLTIESEADTTRHNRLEEALAKGEVVADEDHYDKVVLGLLHMKASLGVYTAGAGFAERGPLLDEVDVVVAVSRSLTPETERLPVTMVKGEVGGVFLHLSPDRYGELLRIADFFAAHQERSPLEWDELSMTPPRFVSASEKPRPPGPWEPVRAAFNPATRRLTLYRREGRVVLSVGKRTTIRSTVGPNGVQLLLRLPQYLLEMGSFIEVVVAGPEQAVFKLERILNAAKWAQEDWERGAKEAEQLFASAMENGDDTVPASPTQPIVRVEQVSVLCSLRLDDVVLSLHESSGDSVANLTAHTVVLGLSRRAKDTSVELNLGSLYLGDMLREGCRGGCPLFGMLPYDEGAQGIGISVQHITEGSPLADTKKLGVSCEVACGKLMLDMERTTFPAILGCLGEFAETRKAVAQSISQEYTETQPSRSRWQHAAEALQDSQRTGVEMVMQTVAARFGNRGVVFLESSSAASKITVTLDATGTSLVAFFGEFEVLHHAAWNPHHRSLVAQSTDSSDGPCHFVEVKYHKQAVVSPEGAPPEFKAALELRMARVRLVYLRRVVSQIASYFNSAYLLSRMPKSSVVEARTAAARAASAAQVMAKEAARQGASGASPTQLNITILRPTVILPFSCSSTSQAELIPGSFYLKSDLAQRGAGWVELYTVQVHDTALDLKGVLGTRCIMERNTFRCTIERPVQGYDKHAETVVDASLGDIEIRMSREDCEAFRLIHTANLGDGWTDPCLQTGTSCETDKPEPAEGEDDQGEAEEDGVESPGQSSERLALVVSARMRRLRSVLLVSREGEREGIEEEWVAFELAGLRLQRSRRCDGAEVSEVCLESMVVKECRSGGNHLFSLESRTEPEVAAAGGTGDLRTRGTPMSPIEYKKGALHHPRRQSMHLLGPTATAGLVTVDRSTGIPVDSPPDERIVMSLSGKTATEITFAGKLSEAPGWLVLSSYGLVWVDAAHPTRGFYVSLVRAAGRGVQVEQWKMPFCWARLRITLPEGQVTYAVESEALCVRLADGVKEVLELCKKGVAAQAAVRQENVSRLLEKNTLRLRRRAFARWRRIFSIARRRASASEVSLRLLAVTDNAVRRRAWETWRGLRGRGPLIRYRVDHRLNAKIDVNVPQCTFTLIPRVLCRLPAFFSESESTVRAEALGMTDDDLRKLDELVSAGISRGDLVLCDSMSLEGDIVLGEAHRLVVPPHPLGEVVLDAVGHAVLLSGGCRCSEADSTPFDRQTFNIVVAEGTRLSIRNAQIYAARDPKDYIYPFSGTVDLSESTVQVASGSTVLTGHRRAHSTSRRHPPEVRARIGMSVVLTTDASKHSLVGTATFGLHSWGTHSGTMTFVTADDLGVFPRHEASQEAGGHAVIGPGAVQATITERSASQTKEVAVKAQNVDWRIGFRDIKLFADIAREFAVARPSEKKEPPRLPRDIYAPHMGLQTTEGVVRGSSQGKGSGRKGGVTTVTVSLSTWSAILVDDQLGHDTEVIRVRYGQDGLSGSLELKDGGVQGALQICASISTFSPTISVWEEFVQQHRVAITISKDSQGMLGLKVAVWGDSAEGSAPVEVYLASGTLRHLNQLAKRWQEGIAADVAPGGGTGNSYPYLLRNGTGHTLRFRGSFHAADVPLEEGCLVVGGAPVGFAVRATSAVPSIQLDFGGGVVHDIAIATEQGGQVLEIPREAVEHDSREVHVQVYREGSRVVVSLLSKLVVLNAMALPLLLKIQAARTDPTLLRVPPRDSVTNSPGECSVPLWALAGKENWISLRPSEGEYHWGSSGGVHFGDVGGLPVGDHPLAVKEGVLQCGYRGEDVDEADVYCYYKRDDRFHGAFHQHRYNVILCQAPLLVENLLPYPMTARIRSGGKAVVDVFLEAGEAREVHTVSTDVTLSAVFEVSAALQTFSPSEELVIHEAQSRRNFTTPTVTVTDTASNRTCHLVLISNGTHTKRAVREVAVYAPYWIVNLSPLPSLHFCEDGEELRCITSAPLSPGGDTPLLYSTSNSDVSLCFSGKLRVAMASKESSLAFSNPFSHDTVGVPLEALLPESSRDGAKKRVVAIAITLAPGKYGHTKVVKVMRRWAIVNSVGCTVWIAPDPSAGEKVQELSDRAEVSDIPGGDAQQRSLYLSTDKKHWATLVLTEAGTQHAVLPDGVVDCRIVQKGAVTFVVLEKARVPPLRVVNFSFHEAVFTIPSRDDRQYVLTAKPFTALPCYPDPHSSSDGVPVVTVRCGKLDADVKVQLGSGAAVGGDTAARVVLGCDSILLVVEDARCLQPIHRDSQFKEGGSLCVELAASVGLSLLHSRDGSGLNAARREIAYFTADGIAARWKKRRASMDLELSVATMQLDNQLTNATFPVALSFGIGSKQTAREKDLEAATLKHAIQISIVDYDTGRGELASFRYVGVFVQEVNVAVTDTFLLRELASCAREIMGNPLEPTLRAAITETPQYDPQKFQASSKRVYADEFHLNPIKVVLSYQVEGEEVDTPGSVVTSTLTMAVQNLEDARLCLNVYHLAPATGTWSDLAAAVKSHYKTQILLEGYKVVGALDIMGNPAGLISNVGNGISDLFYEPAQGIMKGPADFVAGVGRGVSSVGTHTVDGAAGTIQSLARGVGGGVANLSMDDEYIKRRRIEQRRKAKTIGDGLVQGGKAIGGGVVDGAAGLVLQPIRGFQKGGLLGGLAGVAKGIIGVPVKVLTGAVDGVGKTAEGLRGAVGSDEERMRKRLPHAVVNGVLGPYSFDHSRALYVLQTMCDGQYVDDDLCLYAFHDLDSGATHYIFSSARILSIDAKWERVNWCARYVDLSAVTPVPGTGLRIQTSVSEHTVHMGSAGLRQALRTLYHLLPPPLARDLASAENGEVEIFEAERQYRTSGWSKSLLAVDGPAWSDAEGNESIRPEDMTAPPVCQCVWLEPWEVDPWTYGIAKPSTANLPSPPDGGATVRRRRWHRRYGGLTKTSSGKVESLPRHCTTLSEEASANRVVETFENQRSYGFGFTSVLLPTDPYAWSDRFGRLDRPKERFTLEEGWRWLGDWKIDRTKADKDGWQYALDFTGPWHAIEGILHTVRRRRWTRIKVLSPHRKSVGR
eukprot:Sspe_Gene.60748::Locus_33541_Transcript_1_1_Confidence_1.000_Length_11348::g.60748::m.60748/K19525/VPS13A_C; vacuolar protein sorting-associated protein 13A/C